MVNKHMTALTDALASAPRGTAKRLADLIGKDASFISQMKRGTRPLPAEWAPIFGEELRIDPRLISAEFDRVMATSGGVAAPISSHETVREHSLPNQRRKVQIEGATAMDERGFWQRGDAETELWEVNTNDPLAYGVRLLTQHFEPVVSPGQCLLVSPAQEAKIGRWVLVTLIDERQSFRKLLGHDYGVWHFADVNRPASYLDLADDDVRRVERVMSVSWTD